MESVNLDGFRVYQLSPQKGLYDIKIRTGEERITMLWMYHKNGLKITLHRTCILHAHCQVIWWMPYSGSLVIPGTAANSITIPVYVDDTDRSNIVSQATLVIGALNSNLHEPGPWEIIVTPEYNPEHPPQITVCRGESGHWCSRFLQ